jgi:lipoate---protein ligase
MAPSRGVSSLWKLTLRLPRRNFSSFSEAVSHSQNTVQSYISTSRDPYLNLSLEHYILQRSPPTSTILFIYINKPCVVIGRNQNPWLEVNLNALKSRTSSSNLGTHARNVGNIDLVRRRSGGGTVFHDEGNVNWSVICPPASFTRSKHAEMVVRALRSLGVERSRVGARYDVLLDQGPVSDTSVSPKDAHKTPFTDAKQSGVPPLKVSGSAYKLTRTRALHHGTCLLSSPNLQQIPGYLHSPAKPYIKAKGVESVSSPVGNIGLSNDEFIEKVSQEYHQMYGKSIAPRMEIGQDELDLPEIQNGYEELKVSFGRKEITLLTYQE